ncbi:MAG: TolC family protein [Bacteroidales bacterium]|nr:TolC family protein [Bacteroidales bacterium]
MKRLKFIKIAAFSLILFISAPALNAQEMVRNLSLTDALAVGLDNNYQIRISDESVRIAENNNSWGAAGIFPSISLGAFQYNRYDDGDSRTVPGDRDTYYTNFIAPYVNLNWSLFKGFAVHITKDKLAALQEYSEGYATIVVENTIQGIVLAYYNALLQEELLQVTVEVKALSRDRYNYMTFKKDIGGAVTYDVLQAKNAYLDDSTTNLLQQLNVKNAYLNLSLLLGEEEDIQYKLTDEFQVQMINFTIDTLLQQMLSSNTSIRNQYINQVILKKDVNLAKSNMYPVLSLNSGFDHYNNRTKYIDSDPHYTNSLDYYANFTLSFNLFNGGNVRRGIRNARISERIGELEIEEMEISLSNLIKTDFELYSIRQELYMVSMANLESATLNMEISTEKFRSGAINSFNFRDVQVIYLRAAAAKYQAIFNLIDIQTELLRLSGGIISEF